MYQIAQQIKKRKNWTFEGFYLVGF